MPTIQRKIKTFTPLFLLICAFALSEQCFAQEADVLPGGWKLIWSDEFNGTTLDKSKWFVENAALVKNNELEYYRPDEVYLHNGLLTLRSRKRTIGNRKYTSGLVDTRGKFKMLYGRVEVRARLPKGPGIWPAHWMMPNDNSWPPEIDIMELLGHRPDQIHMTCHFKTRSGVRNHGNSFSGPDFSKDFHVFAIEWERGEIRWYVDNDLKFSTNDNVPRVPLRLILNTAVGGDWPGNPTKKTVFPQYHDIDYVRVYQKKTP